jgi:hypothetical protein
MSPAGMATAVDLERKTVPKRFLLVNPITHG